VTQVDRLQTETWVSEEQLCLGYMVRKVDDERVCCWRLFFVHRVDSAVFELLQNSPVLQTAEERENRGKSLLSLPIEHHSECDYCIHHHGDDDHHHDDGDRGQVWGTPGEPH
jgi:hypothetical protein